MVYVMQEAQTIDAETVLFYASDNDRNGTIDLDEFLETMKRLKVNVPLEKQIQLAKQVGGEPVQISYDKFTKIMKMIKQTQ